MTSRPLPAKLAAFDFETTGLDPMRGARPFVVGMKFLNGERFTAEPGTAVWDVAVHVLQDPTIEKIGHNVKFELKQAWACGIDVRGPLHDSQNMAHICSEYERGYSIEALAERYLDFDRANQVELKKWLKSNARGVKLAQGRKLLYDDVPRTLLLDYLADDVENSMGLFCYYWPRMEEYWEMYRWEMALVPVLASMEIRGITIDKAYCKEKELHYRGEALRKGAKLKELLSNPKFNPGSPKQIAEVLLAKGLEFGHDDYTEKGNLKTDIKTMAKFPEDPFCRLLSSYRKDQKLGKTYFQGALLGQQNGGVVRCSLKQSVSKAGKGIKTARLACSDPNLQNIPARDAVTVRRAFIPRRGCQLWFMDYSQIELILFVDMFGIESMARALKAGQDLHEYVGRRAIGMNEAEFERLRATDKLEFTKARFLGKQLNYGTIYGSGDRRFWKELSKLWKGVPFNQARRLRQEYFRLFPEVRQTIMEQSSNLLRVGYVKDVYGRKYRVPAELAYKAVNAIVQGQAAAVMKRALVRMAQVVRDYEHESYGAGKLPFPRPALLLTIHDEVISEALPEDAKVLMPALAAAMECREFGLPVPVDVSWTDTSWADKKKAVDLPWWKGARFDAEQAWMVRDASPASFGVTV